MPLSVRMRSLAFILIAPMACFVTKTQAAPAGKSKPSTPSVPIVGEAVPVETARVITMVGGLVEKVYVKVGDQVVKDQLLMEIDADRHRHAVRVAQVRFEDKGSLKQAYAEKSTRQAEFNQIMERRRRRQATDYDVDRIQGLLDMAEGKVTSAEAQKKLHKLELENAKEQLNKRLITSPVDGVVIEVTKEIGQQASPGNVVVRIGNPRELQMDFRLPAQLAEQLRVGAPVAVRNMVDSTIYFARITSLIKDEKAKDGSMIANARMESQPGSTLNPKPGSYELTPDKDLDVSKFE